MADLLPFSDLFRITDGMGRIYRELKEETGAGSGNGSYYTKACELTAIDQSGANGIYTVLGRDLVDSFAIGDYVGYLDVSAKIVYSETKQITGINRSTGAITTSGKFTVAPVDTDLLTLVNTKAATAAAEILAYILALDVADQENDLLGAAMSIRENTKSTQLIHPALSALAQQLNTHYTNGIDAQLKDSTLPLISTPTNSGSATVDVPDDYALWFTVGDEVTYYDDSLGYRSLESLVISAIGAAGSGTDAGTTLITMTGVWSAAPIAGDALFIYDRVSPEFKAICDKIGITITAAHVWPEEVSLGTYAATGAAAGTLTDGDAVDTAEYGGADLEVEVINQAIGANALVLAITAKYYDAAGDEQTDTGLTCSVTGTSVVGTRFSVTAGAAERRYHDVTAVTNSNGNNGDDVEIVTRLDRQIRRS
jgi:hypothetical protein